MIKKYTIREMLKNIEKRPGMYLGTDERRLDYLCHYLDGWFVNNECKENNMYRAKMANWIYDYIENNSSGDYSKIEFSFLWYKMIYCITNTEEEAWKLFFKLSYEYLDYLEKED